MATHPGVYCLRSNELTWDEEQLWRTYTMLTDLVLAPVQIRTYSLARWRFCRQHRVAAMGSGAADVGRAPKGAL